MDDTDSAGGGDRVRRVAGARGRQVVAAGTRLRWSEGAEMGSETAGVSPSPTLLG
jgi:hypothetical protein